MYKNNFLLIEIFFEELPSIYVIKLNNNFIKNKIGNFIDDFFFYSHIEFYVTLRRISFVINNVRCVNNLNRHKFKSKIINLIKNYLFVFLNKLFKDFVLVKFDKKDFKFFCPIRNVVILLNSSVVDVKIFNFFPVEISYGNKFVGCSHIIISHVNNYVSYLYNYGKVILDFDERKNKIVQFLRLLFLKKKYNFKYDDYFLNVVSSMIEYPVFVISKFSDKFLFLPIEILLYIIKDLYRCFPIFNSKNSLTNNFLIVTEINEHDDNLLNIQINYRKNIEYKLSNVLELYYIDVKNNLINYLPKLKEIIFFDYLGNLYDKTKRIRLLSIKIFIILKMKFDKWVLFRSISLIKCDLSTSLCKEYMNFKGVIGMYYSFLSKESFYISLIIKEHYYPRYFYDKLPSNFYSKIISLSDKIDTVVGILLYDLYFSDSVFYHKVKCSNDPYGVKKLVSVILRLILVSKLCINLFVLVKFSVLLFNFMFKITNFKYDCVNYIMCFFYKRLFNYFVNLGYEKKIVNSFINLKINNIFDIENRINIISQLKDYDIFLSLISTVKRIRNIIYKSRFIINKEKFNVLYFINREEFLLYDYLLFFDEQIKIFNLDFNFYNIVDVMFLSFIKIKNFFNNVKINSDNYFLTNNRLFLLNELYKKFLSIIDFSVFY